jgi:hypothetical protein
MNAQLIQTLRSRGRLWKTVALEFAEAMKGNQNDTVIYLRARVRFLEEEDRKLAEELEKGAQP